MALTFIFADGLNESGCLSLRLENDQTVIAAVAHRSFEEIRALQVDSSTIIVAPATCCGFHTVDLPWLSEKKARTAIPYALEEQLAQKHTSLQFAFDRAFHHNNLYLVAVVEKVWLGDLIARLDEAKIQFTEITIDWFALEAGEVAVTPGNLLLNLEKYRGALSFDIAQSVCNALLEERPILTFNDSSDEIQPKNSVPMDQSFYLWIAKRLQHKPKINLLQGDFHRGSDQAGLNKRWIWITSALAALWLISTLSLNIFNLVRLHHENQKLDQETAVIYRQFFPGAQQIISPRFRITQLMKTGEMTGDSTFFWLLLDKLDQAISLTEVKIDSLSYRNKTLSLGLKAKDFKVLEGLAERLRQLNLKVSQTQAASHDHEVIATMELKL